MRKSALRLIAFILIMSVTQVVSSQEVFKRDIEQVSFVPKGQWITGVSVGYNQSNQNNYQFLVFENLSGDTYSFKVTPMVMYAFKDNLAAGIKFGYQRSRTQLDDGKFVLDSETEFNADNISGIQSNFFVMGAFRNYISFGKNHRFGLFNEVQLQLGGGRSRLSNYTGSGDNRHIEGTYETNFSMELGLSPGMIMFLNNYSAIEVSVGVLGFGYTHTKSVTNQVYVSNRNSKHANFKINLFSIQFGMAFYL